MNVIKNSRDPDSSPFRFLKKDEVRGGSVRENRPQFASYREAKLCGVLLFCFNNSPVGDTRTTVIFVLPQFSSSMGPSTDLPPTSVWRLST